jgi:hypothetical protein
MIETKTVDFKVEGKDGLVNVHTIQRHKPYFPMCFIRTDTGHMLFCQENHPVWIQTSDGESTVVEAKDIVAGQDKIWVDNTDIKIPVCKDLVKYRGDDYENFYITLEKIFGPNTTVPIELDPEYFIGDDHTNLYFNLDKLNMYNSDYLELLIRFTVPRNNGFSYLIKSFNLVSQLKLIADHLKCECIIDLISGLDVDDTSWYIKNLNLKKKDEFKVEHQDYVVVEQVISGIENYQGYVYDLKTDSEEYMNNNVQTHNSFHCFHGDSIVDVHGLSIDSQEFSLESLFDFANDNLNLPIIYNVPFSNGMSQDEIHIPDDVPMEVPTTVNGKYTTTKVKKIIRHKQDMTTKMITIKYFLPSIGYGKSTPMLVVSQDNHKHFKIENGIPVITEAKDLIPDDYIWVYNYTNHIQLCKIHSVYNIPNISENEYVYDLTTESGTLFVNGMYTHNTGGAVEFKKIDILKELGLNIDSSEETHLKRLFNQVDNDFFCNNALTKIVINKTLFQDEYAIKKEGNIYKLPLGYFVLTTGEIVLDATIEQPIELSIPTDYSETATTIELVYGQGDKILHIKSFSIAPEKIAQHLDSLVGGKSPWTTPESLLLKFHNDLAGFNFYDMTHLEVIVASVLRNKLDPMIPARLKEPYNPETYSIKALPGVISWSLGMAYENISKALSTGLISDDAKNLSQIEKVLYGEPLSDLSHELLAAKRKKR